MGPGSPWGLRVHEVARGCVWFKSPDSALAGTCSESRDTRGACAQSGEDPGVPGEWHPVPQLGTASWVSPRARSFLLSHPLHLEKFGACGTRKVGGACPGGLPAPAGGSRTLAPHLPRLPRRLWRGRIGVSAAAVRGGQHPFTTSPFSRKIAAGGASAPAAPGSCASPQRATAGCERGPVRKPGGKRRQAGAVPRSKRASEWSCPEPSRLRPRRR